MITIALAPASYSPPQSQQATVVGSSSGLDLVAVAPTRWVGQGATLAVPLTVEALDLGVPKANVAINFVLTKGAAALLAGSATTNGSGVATVTAQLTNQNADVQVSACVAPNNSPCQTFTLFSTPASLWTLETVSGSPQAVPAGQLFQALVMRVTDGSSASNPVMGVNVTFLTTLARVPEDGMPVILGSSQMQVVSTQDGLASMVPSTGGVGPCDVFITVSAGSSTVQIQMENVAAIVAGPTNGGIKGGPVRRGPHFGPQPDSQAAALQGIPGMLFAVPEVVLTDDAMANQSSCSAAFQDPGSGADAKSGMNGTAGAGDAVSRVCDSVPELPKVENPQPPAETTIKVIDRSCR